MIWETYINRVLPVMEEHSYKRLHLTYSVTDAPVSYADRVYTITPTTPYTSDATGASIINRRYANFEIMYKVKDNSEFDKAYDEFMDLIPLLPNWTLIEEAPIFEILDDINLSYAVGRFTLLVSTEVVC